MWDKVGLLLGIDQGSGVLLVFGRSDIPAMGRGWSLVPPADLLWFTTLNRGAPSTGYLATMKTLMQSVSQIHPRLTFCTLVLMTRP
jgi:hypothetical protein